MRRGLLITLWFPACFLGACVDGSIGDVSPEGAEATQVPTPDVPASEAPTDAGTPVVDAKPEAEPPPKPTDATGYPADDPAATDTHALSEDLAEHLAIHEVAFYQSVKVSIARDGAAVPRKRWEKVWGTTAAEVPIVAGRDALLRIFVKPEAGYVTTTITARVKVKGPSETKVFSATKAVSAASTDGDLGSTLNVTIPAAALVPGARLGVVLNAPGKRPEPAGKSTARFPEDGSLHDPGVGAGGDVMKVVLVPMRYRGDGSNRMPDVQADTYRDHFFRRYPVARVDVQVHATIDYAPAVTKDNGIGDMLNVIGALHDKEKAADDTYYVGLLKPAEKFWDFCGSGCVAGLSFVGQPASVWWGYTGDDWAGGTGAHEVGHAHGLPHAPCGVDDPDYWPTDADHQGAKLGSWGWDPVVQKLFDPGGDPNPSAKSTLRDLMSYCGPTWIGDFNYAKLWHRVQADNGVKAAAVATPAASAMESVYVDESGHATWEAAPVDPHGWMQHGQPTSVTVVDERGESTRPAMWFPYDHLAGGHMLVPTDVAHRPRTIRTRGFSVTR